MIWKDLFIWLSMDIENFKITVDIMASIASIIAVILVGFSWYRNTIKPIKITDVYVEEDDKNCWLMIEMVNQKKLPYKLR